MKATINVGSLQRCEPLDDDTLDILLRLYCGLETHQTIAYVNSLQIDTALMCGAKGSLTTKEDVYKKLGPLFRQKAELMEGLVVLVHGPNEGSPIVNHNNQNNHWSILYYTRLTNRFFHYDSVENFNIKKAIQIVNFLVEYDVVPQTGIGLFQPNFTPQQPGNWECSFYCIVFAHILNSKRISLPISSNNFFDYLESNWFDMSPTSAFRQHILDFAINFQAIHAHD